ncbi:MAG: hypothetical protein HYS05_02710 [Acidobacteria bacterium]|nr:hypothetical protein [Acidobacteriota bacterium]
MRTRSRVFAVTIALTVAVSAHVGGQAAKPSSSTRPPSRGRDLAGVWTFSTLTPLERPAEFTGRPVLTDSEAAAYEKRTIERNDRDRRDRDPVLDVNGAYNDAWFDRGLHLATVNGTKRTSLIVDPPDGRIPAFTPAGQSRAAARDAQRRLHPADGPEDRPLAERCLSFNAGPPMLPGPYNNYVELILFRDYFVIFNEMIHDARIVPLDGRPHAAPAIRKWQGDSRGHWEGDTLVIDTTNFTNRTNFRGASEHLRLVERFTRVDAGTLLYEFTVQDPTAFTKPWSVALPMTKTKDRILEYACHEANYAMTDILRGARFEERAGKPR